MSKRESINQEPLTIEELKTMAGLPVWCPEEEAYGIVMCDKIGQWAGIPFLHGVWYSDDDGVGEAIATAIGLITVLAMIAMIPIIVIGGAIMLIWSIFAG